MDTKFNIEEIKEKLCYYDERNPSNQTHFRAEYPEMDKKDNRDCYCDNCFYGRTELSNIIIDIMNELNKTIK